MKIKLIVIGKTDSNELNQLIQTYLKRLQHYIKMELEIVPDIKNRKQLSEKLQKEKEGELLLKSLKNTDVVVLLDEKGKQFRSVEFSNYLQGKMNASTKQLVFIIGGPYGFSDTIYKRATSKISLSKMTFSHQMIRLFMVEQIYRAFTILRNEPYHHE